MEQFKNFSTNKVRANLNLRSWKICENFLDENFRFLSPKKIFLLLLPKLAGVWANVNAVFSVLMNLSVKMLACV